MTITTYTELQDAIKDYSNRDDLGTAPTKFIQTVESFLNRELRVSDMETTADLTIDAQTEALPSDFLALRRIYLSGSPNVSLRYLDPFSFWARKSESGTPEYFTIEGGNIIFSPSPDSTFTGKILYYQEIPPLSENSSNWVLAKHPDVYLHGALAECMDYILADPTRYRQKFLYEVQKIMEISDQKYAAPLQVTFSTSMP